MAEKLYPTKHVTIGSVIDAGLRDPCGHDEDLDLPEVARKLGRKHSSLPVHLVPKLVCSNCGSKNVGTVLAPAEEAPREGQIEHVREKWQEPVDPDESDA